MPDLLAVGVQFAMDPYSANWCGSRVSRGAAVGIAIVFFILIFLFILGAWYWVRRRQVQQVPALHSS